MLRTCNFQTFITNNSLKCLCISSAISAIALGWNNTSPAQFTFPQRKLRVAESGSPGEIWLCVGSQPRCVRNFNSSTMSEYKPTLFWVDTAAPHKLSCISVKWSNAKALPAPEHHHTQALPEKTWIFKVPLWRWPLKLGLGEFAVLPINLL